MNGQCALSGKNEVLQLSHIYPKFAVKYLRKTANNGRLRSYVNVNMPRQDGLKMYLLSSESEKLFSTAETWFAGNIFHPLTQHGRKQFSYDNHLYYFSISLLWRALQVELRSGKYENQPYYQTMLSCEQQWRSFLLKGYIPVTFKDAFVMAVHPNQLQIPDLNGLEYYLMRNLDLTVVTDELGCVYIYMKLPRFLFWAPLVTRYFSHANLIDIQGGDLDTLLPPADQFMLGFIPNRVREIERLKLELSPDQEEATLQRVLADRDGFLNSEAGMLIDKLHR